MFRRYFNNFNPSQRFSRAPRRLNTIFFSLTAAAAYFGRPWSSEEDENHLNPLQKNRLSNRGMYTYNEDENVDKTIRKQGHYVNWVKAGDYDVDEATGKFIGNIYTGDDITNVFMQFASMIVVSFSSFCSYNFIKTFCDFDIYNYDKFEKYFYNHADRPLLTVGNHQSTVDDPVIISMIAPFRELTYDTRRLRWGLCAEEICFKNQFFSSFFGAGKILPIKRNLTQFTKDSAIEKNCIVTDNVKHSNERVGINQTRFHAFTNKLQPGHWVHIFPEGRVCQQRLNVPNTNWKRPYLRWGVGKMIVQSVRKGHYPIVLPFYHDGLKDILPCDENDNLISNIPKTGKRVVINFDDPIVYEDLIENYLKKENNTFSDNPWDEIEDSRPPPTKEELKLYSDITKRVMDKLLELETKTKMM